MNLLRRKFLKTATYIGATTAAIGSGVLLPQRVLGAYNAEAFAAKDVNSAIAGSMGTDQHTASDAIKLKAPEIAENGGCGSGHRIFQHKQCRSDIHYCRG